MVQGQKYNRIVKVNIQFMIFLVMIFLGTIMRELEGDCILLLNNDVKILMRDNESVIVDSLRACGSDRYHFEYLGVEFVTEK